MKRMCVFCKKEKEMYEIRKASPLCTGCTNIKKYREDLYGEDIFIVLMSDNILSLMDGEERIGVKYYEKL